MVRGFYLGVYATVRDEDQYILAWEVYWLIPWPLPRRFKGWTLLNLQKHMVRMGEGFWESIAGFGDVTASVEGRVSYMAVELARPTLSDTAIAIRHRTKPGKKVRMSFQSIGMSFFGIGGRSPPPRPLGYSPWRGSWTLGKSISLDHDPFAQMSNIFQGRSIRVRLNAAFRAGTRIRYRTSPGGKGRHLILSLKKRPTDRLKFGMRRELADDGARIFLDRERWRQLQKEPAHGLRAPGLLWDSKRSFNPETRRIGTVEHRAGRWFAWRTRGALRRGKR